MKKILIVGNPLPYHVGAHFYDAVRQTYGHALMLDISRAFEGNFLLRKAFWHFFDRRPVNLYNFSSSVQNFTLRNRPNVVLSTGISPIVAKDIEVINFHGGITVNYLTDDPFNVAHRAQWFLESLKRYSFVFSPRKANIEDLKMLGCKNVSYLPFAYNPKVHLASKGLLQDFNEPGVLFIGGADHDRLPFIRALINSQIKVTLYGGYWNRYPDLASFWKGHADLATLCQVTQSAQIVLCLVRRANRDGHSMRSFEAAAMRGCLLMEDTVEHRELFGKDGECVFFFRNLDEMVVKARMLLKHPEERERLAKAAHDRIIGGQNTYADRIQTILNTVENGRFG